MSDNQQKSKAEIIEERRANLPLPEDPPVESDFDSANPDTVNVGSGRTQGGISYGKGESAGLDSTAATGGTTGGVDSGVGRAGYDTAKDAAKK